MQKVQCRENFDLQFIGTYIIFPSYSEKLRILRTFMKIFSFSKTERCPGQRSVSLTFMNPHM